MPSAKAKNIISKSFTWWLFMIWHRPDLLSERPRHGRTAAVLVQFDLRHRRSSVEANTYMRLPSRS
jgi:hypothetical protein